MKLTPFPKTSPGNQYTLPGNYNEAIYTVLMAIAKAPSWSCVEAGIAELDSVHALAREVQERNEFNPPTTSQQSL
jgi:hypothetical protein